MHELELLEEGKTLEEELQELLDDKTLEDEELDRLDELLDDSRLDELLRREELLELEPPGGDVVEELPSGVVIEELLEEGSPVEVLEESPEELEPPPVFPEGVATSVESEAVHAGELLSVTLTDIVPQPVTAADVEFCHLGLLVRM